jgi:enoyl-CoA hydratase/carnithine racemase
VTTIRFERDGAIGSIVLASPPFNRVDLRFSEGLRAAVHQASESDIRALVVRAKARTSALAVKSGNGQERTSTGFEHLSRT